MSNAKEKLIAAFQSDLPSGVLDFLTTEIPALAATAGSYDADNPTKNCETLAHNLNLIFKEFEGCTPIMIPLMIGQLNTVNQGILLAGLQYLERNDPTFGSSSPEPKEQASYNTGNAIPFNIYITQALQDATTELTYSCKAIDPGEEFLNIPLTQDGGDSEWFRGSLVINTPGYWTAEYTVVFDGFTVTKSVIFDMVSGA